MLNLPHAPLCEAERGWGEVKPTSAISPNHPYLTSPLNLWWVGISQADRAAKAHHVRLSAPRLLRAGLSHRVYRRSGHAQALRSQSGAETPETVYRLRQARPRPHVGATGI